MLSERVFWGVCLACLAVTVALAKSSSAWFPTPQSSRRALAARGTTTPRRSAPLKNNDHAAGPVQCGISFGTAPPQGQLDWISCRDYGDLNWYCPIAGCHTGTSQDTPKSAPWPKGSVQPSITVQSFLAHNLHGVSVVTSVPDKSSSGSNVHVCRWQGREAANNARPFTLSLLVICDPLEACERLNP
ncbi:hypothetical protein VP01_3111g2 [Puccinia sorghi]|uniref:Uncharacterized protein n=1 Tax=Puccinia sorghi TaxID=27349 RepID=A0A0L6V173_9BASI|nr:hypothetical protein VP01_3111g2 [Puccinia sorghi]